MSYREFYLGKNQKYLDTIKTQARIHGYPEQWLAGIIDAEIGRGQGPNVEWNPAIQSGVGESSAVGLGQITAGTWKDLGKLPWGEVNRVGRKKEHISPSHQIIKPDDFLALRTDGDINIAGIGDLMSQNEITLMAKMFNHKQRFDELPPRDQADLFMRSHMMRPDLALATRFPETYKEERHQGMAQRALTSQFLDPKNPDAAAIEAQQWYAANGNDWVSAFDDWYRKKGDGSRFDPDKFMRLSPRGLDEGASGDAPQGRVPWSTGLESPEQRALDQGAVEGYAPWGGDKERD